MTGISRLAQFLFALKKEEFDVVLVADGTITSYFNSLLADP
jgi:hypothetical protein